MNAWDVPKNIGTLWKLKVTNISKARELDRKCKESCQGRLRMGEAGKY